MMNGTYQLIVIGDANIFLKEILDTFFSRTVELGIDPAMISVIDAGNFSQYRSGWPAFCIYFGGRTGRFKDTDIVRSLQSDARLILPVVDDIKKFAAQVPRELRPVNGFELRENTGVERLVSVVLEGFSLLRTSRRLFISYKRDESRAVAVQLFEQLEAAGFDVFLDTHSIRPAQPFQDELWHRLVDTDVVVLLNTPNFLGSEWTKEELARANAMTVGILQVQWPGNKLKRDAELSLTLELDESDFGNDQFVDSGKYLDRAAIGRLVSAAESLRARSLAARQFNLVKEFIAIVNNTNAPVIVQPAKYIIVKKTNGELLIFVPTVGVPQAFAYYQADQIAKMIKTGKVAGVYLLYDHLYIRKDWLAHLTWLDTSFDITLKMKTLKLLDAAAIFGTLI